MTPLPPPQQVRARRADLLPRVLGSAANLPFYRDRWGAAAPTTLEPLPLTGRADLAALCEDAIDFDRLGGLDAGLTADGEIVLRAWTRRELEPPVASGATATDAPQGALLVDLEEPGIYGPAPAVPRGHLRLAIPIVSHEFADKAWNVISQWREQYGERFPLRTLAGPPEALATFAAYLRWRGIAPDTIGFGSLHAYGARLPAVARAELRQWFGVPIAEDYAPPHVRGKARRCTHCDHFHFGADLWPQFVGLATNHPVDRGLARLVVTELAEVSDTPLVRFDTGDLVEVHAAVCPLGVEAFDFVGAREQAVAHPTRSDLVVPRGPVDDALLACGGAARREAPAWADSPFREPILGPTYAASLTDSDAEPVFRCTVRPAPGIAGEGSDVAAVVEALHAAWPALRGLRVEIEFDPQLRDETPNAFPRRGGPQWGSD